MPKPANLVDSFTAVEISRDPRFIDLTGQTFTRLTVISYAGKYKWNCSCWCGAKVIVKGGLLRNGNTKSCGCLHREWMATHNTRHGEATRARVTPEYRAYHQAKDRCTNPNYHAYAAYGGRGIEFRFDSVQQFLDEVGRRPTSRHTLDRIDVNGHYEAGNVRWVTMHEQNRNRTDHRYITIDGVSRCVADWADHYGISPDTVHDRHASGWCDYCSVAVPAKRGRTCRHKRHFM
jgi:hypothetical protein